MSSAGGGSGIGGGGGNNPITLNPEASGAAAVAAEGVEGEAELSPQQVAALETARLAQLGDESSFELRRQLGVAGPASTSAGITDLDQELADNVFTPNGVANPFNANTTPSIFKQLSGTDFFNESVGTLTAFLNNPIQANSEEFLAKFDTNLKALGESLQGLYNYGPRRFHAAHGHERDGDPLPGVSRVDQGSQ